MHTGRQIHMFSKLGESNPDRALGTKWSGRSKSKAPESAQDYNNKVYYMGDYEVPMPLPLTPGVNTIWWEPQKIFGDSGIS